MRRFTNVSLAALAAAAFFAAPASAQSTPWTASGELTDSDAQLPLAEGEEAGGERHRYDDLNIRLEAGQRYRITLNSDAFDTYARLLRNGETIAENDDFGDSLNSRINFSATDGGDYVLRVSGYAADARGAYTAEVAQQAPLPAPVSQPTRNVPVTGTWALYEGTLSADDPDRDGKHYDDVLIHVAAGQVRYISLEGVGFDAMVEVYGVNDREGSPIVTDDDTGAGFNSLLVFDPEEAGDYIVRVTSFSEGASGSYRLWVSQ